MKTVFADNDVIDSRFKDTVFVVEADSYAQHQLWLDYHLPKMPKRGELYSTTNTKIPNEFKVQWKQDCAGSMFQTGELAGKPICTTFIWATLDGHRVVFYDNTSNVVDHKQVEEWLNKHCCPKYDNDYRIARTDASNFHHVIHCIKRMQEEKGIA